MRTAPAELRSGKERGDRNVAIPIVPGASFGASRRTSSDMPTRSRCRSVSLVVIQRQLGHANLGITSVYLQGIESSETVG